MSKTRTKKICIVGGEDVHKRIALSHYLIKDGFDVTIIGTSAQPFPDNITYYDYNLNRSFSPTSDFKTIRWYKKFFKAHDFDVIQTFDTKPNFLLPLALINTKTPIVRTITGLGTTFMLRNFKNYVLKIVYTILHFIIRNRVSNTTFQNTDDRDIFLNRKLITADNHSMIYSSGIELNNITQTAPRKNELFTFICVSRLIYEKGITNLLDASRLCRQRGFDFRVLLVGPLEENSPRLNENILKEHEDVVEWLGYRTDINELLLKSDAFIFPTNFREGFARVLLEAAAVGLPIIATNVTGVKEFAKHNEIALIVEPEDTEALADAMIKIATDKKLADTFSANALNRIKKFSTENIARQYITIFNDLIHSAT